MKEAGLNKIFTFLGKPRTINYQVANRIELLMAAVWFGLAYFDRIHGPASRVWGSVHLFSLAIMLITYFIGNVVLVIGLCFGLLLNIFDVVAANPRLAREYDQAEMEHQIKDSMIERYGLMTMIALGEICMR